MKSGMIVAVSQTTTSPLPPYFSPSRDAVELIRGEKFIGTGGAVDHIPLVSLPKAGPSRSKPSSSCTIGMSYCI